MASMLRVTRLSHLLDRLRAWDIVLDETVVGRVANGKFVDGPIECGHHTVRLGHRWWGSARVPFTVGDLDITEFVCRPRPHLTMWVPYAVASLYRHDVFIALGQVSMEDLKPRHKRQTCEGPQREELPVPEVASPAKERPASPRLPVGKGAVARRLGSVPRR